jgi:perosamine synthetase
MTKRKLDLKGLFHDFVAHNKDVHGLQDLVNRAIKFNLKDQCFYLIPVTKLDYENDERVELFYNARKNNELTFPSRFNVTIEGTKKWLESAVITNPDKLLFWIVDDYFDVHGYLGFLFNAELGQIEIDSVMRIGDKHPGLMSQAMHALEDTADSEFSADDIYLLVLGENKRAIKFYLDLGFEIFEKISYKWEESDGINKLVPSANGPELIFRMRKSLFDVKSVPQKILTAGPSVSSFELVNVVDATVNGWNSNHSDYIRRFEDEFSEYIGSKYALATSSCTGALHLALLASGIGPGDEVIVPDITWVATASAVRYVGATPIFSDVDLADWTMDIDSLSKLVTPKTKAIIPVHLYGYSARINEIADFAKKFNLRLIEDAAPAIGTTFNDKKVGTFGDFGCFSFQGAKLLVTGEGGMLVTDNKELYEKAFKIQDHGRKPGTFWIETLGYKYKMNNVTASFGLGQLRKVENQIYRKTRINNWYRDMLSGLKVIDFQGEISNSSAIHWMTSFTLKSNSPVSRDELISKLATKNIDSRPVFPSISQYKIWGYEANTPENSKHIGSQGINLPSGVNLSKKAIERVSSEIIDILG